MGDVSKIEWLRGGHTSSPWHGCEHKHLGCTNCYAETMAKRNPGVLGVWGSAPFGTRVRSKSFDRNCAKWQKQAAGAGVRSCVFPSICDPFEDWKGDIFDSKGNKLFNPAACRFPYEPSSSPPLTLDDLRADMFQTIGRCPDLDFLLLTKRPENIRKMWPTSGQAEIDPRDAPAVASRMNLIPASRRAGMSFYRSNVNLFYSASDQVTLDAGMPDLLACRDLCPVLGLSLEPLVGPVPNLFRWLNNHELDQYGQPVCDSCGYTTNKYYAHYPVACWFCDSKLRHGPRIDWVIVGGESGLNARPCNVGWIRSVVSQCKAARVPCFVKQMGEKLVIDKSTEPWERGDSATIQGRIFLADKKGGDTSEWPADLRIREFPAATTAEVAA